MRPSAPLVLLLAGCMEGNVHNLPDEELPPDPGTGATATATAPPVEGEPVADAGPDQQQTPLVEVVLDGTASHDPSGLAIVAMDWAIVSAPSGSTASLDDAGAARPSFFADLAGEYVFELTVQNEAGAWDST